MRAHRPLEATVAIFPTLVLTNALPYDMDIVVWQVTHTRLPCTFVALQLAVVRCLWQLAHNVHGLRGTLYAQTHYELCSVVLTRYPITP